MGNEKSETDRTKTAVATGGHANLDRQYGNIGISAVAAALPYVDKAKNPHRASTREEEEDHRHSEQRPRSVLEV
jgi:hypothetical protein